MSCVLAFPPGAASLLAGACAEPWPADACTPCLALHPPLTRLLLPTPATPHPAFIAGDLTVRAGDIITGLNLDGQWWTAETSDGHKGTVPDNYVERLVGSAGGRLSDGARPAVPPAAPTRGSSTPRASGAVLTGAADAGSGNPLQAGAASPAGATATRAASAKAARSAFATEDGLQGLCTRRQGRKLQYGFWARNMAHMTVAWCLLFGAAAWLWATQGDALAASQSSEIIGYYTGGTGVLLYLFEYGTALRYPLLNGCCGGCNPTESALAALPLRGLLYIILSLPMFTSYASALAGTALLITGATALTATLRGEECKGENSLRRRGGGRPPASDEAKALAGKPYLERVRLWFIQQIEAGEVGKWLVLLAYVGVNLGLGITLAIVWNKVVDGMPAAFDTCRLEDPVNADKCVKPLSKWAPWAKVCGGLLNLNCALLLLPVLRGLIKLLNNIRCGSGDAAALATYVPLRKNILLHKLIARWVFVLAVGHVAAHFVNYSMAAQATLEIFPNTLTPPWFGSVPKAPWVTGALICIAMFFIYTGASDKVKHAQYEIFWFSHNMFALFYIAQVFHGPVFVYWTIVPMIGYVLERIWRVQRGSRKIYLRAVKWIDPVLCLEWVPHDRDDMQFVEGQYVYLNAPTLSANEWHPFTISSARGDLDMMDFVSLHIRVHKGGWTERLKDLLNTMNPTGEYPFVLYRRNNRGERVVGKLTGPDGQQLIRVDGPHTAPSVHYSSYHASIVVGAGIGLTPSAAILRAVLRYKWKKGHFPEQLYFYWVIRQSEIRAFQWFVQLLAELQAERARDIAARNVNALNHIEIHVFVTRVDNNMKVPPLEDNARLPPAMQAMAPFSPAQLMTAMHHPPASSKNMARVMSDPDNARNRMQDVWLWNGRPDWDTVFKHVKARRDSRFRDVGVCFCGAPVIGKDLKKNCEKHSQLRSLQGRRPSLADQDAGAGNPGGDVRFVLHKEVF